MKTSLVYNSSTLPNGATVVGRSLVMQSDGRVLLTHSYYQNGSLGLVTEPVDTIGQGILLPAWKFGTAKPPLRPVNLQPVVTSQSPRQAFLSMISAKANKNVTG